MTTEKISFKKYLEFFPEIELPIHLTEEIFEEMRRVNIDLPVPLIERFIIEIDQENLPLQPPRSGRVFWSDDKNPSVNP